jgi:hypothetical protein
VDIDLGDFETTKVIGQANSSEKGIRNEEHHIRVTNND